MIKPKNNINPINLIPWMLCVFAVIILLQQVSNGLCYNKAMFDGTVFFLSGLAMMKGREVVSTVSMLILFCCFASFLLYLFPTHVSDFDIPSIFEIAAFTLFVVSFYDKKYARWTGISILVLALAILLLVLLKVNNPLLRSYSPIIAFMFMMLAAWLVFKNGKNGVIET